MVHADRRPTARGRRAPRALRPDRGRRPPPGPRPARASLDGFIAARTGDACFVTGAADRTHLIASGLWWMPSWSASAPSSPTTVGSPCGTVPGPPVRVVLDPDGRAPHAHVLSSVTPHRLGRRRRPSAADRVRPHLEVERLPRSGADRGFAPRHVVATLASRGLGRVLVEGGGVTVSRFLEAGALDRLMVTTAPLLVGDGVPGLRFEVGTASPMPCAPPSSLRAGRGRLCRARPRAPRRPDHRARGRRNRAALRPSRTVRSPAATATPTQVPRLSAGRQVLQRPRGVPSRRG